MNPPEEIRGNNQTLESMGIDGTYDVIVLGVGAAGSAATYHLAKNGASVLGIEQYGIPNNEGSSRGYTRVINPAIREESEYIQLITRSLELWNELQVTHENKLIEQTGALRGWAGPDYIGHRDSFEAALDACETHSIPHEVFDSQTIADRYPGFDPASDTKFLYQPDGGILDPKECIIAHMNAAHAEGATIKGHEKVEEWSPTGNGVQVETSKGTYRADDLVITAGPWIGEIVEELAHIQPARSVMGWFRPQQPDQFTPETFPAFGWDTENGYFYGTPAHGINGVKIGGRVFDDEVTVNPDELDPRVSASEENAIRDFIAQNLPTGIGPTLRLTACMTTRASDEEFILDTHPEYSDIHVAGGFTGMGFMTSSAVGEAVAELALDGDTNQDISRFGLNRF